MTALAWLVQANPRDRALRDAIVDALDALGEEHHAVELVPFSPALPELPFPDDGRRIVCMGPGFVPRVTASRWRPGIWFEAATFRWSAMAAHWGDAMVMRDAEVASARDVLAALDGPRFVRPDADSKVFDGGVFDDAAALARALGTHDREVAVVHGAVVPIDAEWRCFVVDGAVVDASEYRRAGRAAFHRGAPPRVIDLVEAAAARWVPAPVTCIDVAASGDRFGIVEANCFNAARLYAADARTVLAAVAAFARA